MKKLVILLLSLFLMSTSAEAQFLKKLKKNVEKKVENAVIDNVSDKAAGEADKSLDNLWNTKLENMSIPMGGERVDPAEIPENYSFDWEYSMNMQTSEGDMEMAYFLKKDAPYFGMKMPQVENMFIVMDGEKEMTVLFMDSEGSKMLTATRINTELPEDSEVENPYQDAEIREIGSKEILGYNCKGYQSETPEYLFTFYVTDEAGISFTDIYKANQTNMQNGFNPEWFENGTGLMMQMNMEDKNDPSKNVSMTCTKIVEKDLSIDKSEYQTF